MVAGVGALAGGMALVACGLTHSAVAIFLPRTVFAGAGSGMDFMGSMALLNQVGPPQRRAEVLSAYNIVSYVALSVPIVGGGRSRALGLQRASEIFTAMVVAVSTVFVGSTMMLPSEPLPRLSDDGLGDPRLERSKNERGSG